VVEGKVVRWNTQGVFIDIEPEVQGFFDLVQFGVTDHSDLKIKEGEKKEGVVESVNYDAHRLELKLVGAESSADEEKEEKPKKKASKKKKEEEDVAEETEDE